MPKKKGYKIITCETCGKEIAKFRRSAYPNRHVPKAKIMHAIRHHYKDKHPKKFKQFAKKAVATKKKKKGKSKQSKKPKKPEGEGWKWNSRAKHWVKRKKKGRGFEFK